jgi:peptide deformylase
MNIVKYPDPILREISEPVKLPLSSEDRKTLDDMYSWVKEHTTEAVGLSAIQIGIPKRMCAIRITGEKTIGYKLVNPRIIRHSSTKVGHPEGCLSVPEEHDEEIPRYDSIAVMAYDAIQNKTIIIDAHGWLARVLQHEIDHMDGILYIDYIGEIEE